MDIILAWDETAPSGHRLALFLKFLHCSTFAVPVGKAPEVSGTNGVPHVVADEVADEVKGVVEDSMTTMIDVIIAVRIESIEVVGDAMMTLDVEHDLAATTTDMTMTGLAMAMDITLARQVITWDHHRLHKDNTLQEYVTSSFSNLMVFLRRISHLMNDLNRHAKCNRYVVILVPEMFNVTSHISFWRLLSQPLVHHLQ